MITAVCLNPAIDHTVTLPRLVVGELNRVTGAMSQAAGKGVNVAITMARLGEDVTCAAFLPRQNGALLERRLEGEGVRGAFVDTDGAIRTNTKIIDLESGEATEVNESGAAVTAEDLARMSLTLRSLAEKSRVMVLSGSLPPGCPADYYRRVMEDIAGAGCQCFLDADTTRLREGLKAHPFLIKPNRTELEQLTGEKMATLADIDRAARGLVDGGARMVCVSLGGDGAYLTDGATALRAEGLRVQARSTVGAGDAMIGGLAAGYDRGLPMEEMFRLGMACGAASVMSEGTGLIDKATCDTLLPQVKITKLN